MNINFKRLAVLAASSVLLLQLGEHKSYAKHVPESSSLIFYFSDAAMTQQTGIRWVNCVGRVYQYDADGNLSSDFNKSYQQGPNFESCNGEGPTGTLGENSFECDLDSDCQFVYYE